MIDVEKVIKRLKKELGLRYDAELAKKSGIDKSNLSQVKNRGEFTGDPWNKILNLCDENKLDINYVVFGRSVKGVDKEDLHSDLQEIQQQVEDTIDKYN